MTKTFTIVGFAAFLGELATKMPMAENTALEVAGQIVEDEAKRVLGTHDYGWPPLAPSTIARKANGDTPLLETGEMRDSIGHVTGEKRVQIGSNSDKAVWHELGTSRVPPRPFLTGALQHKAEEIVAVIGHNITGTLATGFVPRGTSVPYVQSVKLKP